MNDDDDNDYGSDDVYNDCSDSFVFYVTVDILKVVLDVEMLRTNELMTDSQGIFYQTI